MEANMDEPLERAVGTLSEIIEKVTARGLVEAALFLEMAKLQLQLNLNGITDEEFIALCDALEDGTLKPGSPVAASYPRPRRDGDLRGGRRSWHGAQGAAARRSGRRRAKQ